MHKNIVLIFSGYNNRAVVAFCRFATQKQIPFYIVTSNKNDLIYKTDYKSNIIFERTEANLSLKHILDVSDLIKKKKVFENLFILPSTEYLNRLLLDCKEQLYKKNIRFGLCDKDIYELISDKLSFGKLCKDKFINIPTQVSVETIKFPIVVKPKTYFNNKKEIFAPAIINSTEELDKYFKDKKEEDFYLQEYIAGKSIYFLYYIFENKNYTVYSQENFVQQFNGGSMVLAKSSEYHTNEITTQFANLFTDVGFKGLVMVEVKFYNNKYYMIEANPRLWGPSQLILDAKMDLFDCFAYDNNLISDVVRHEYIPNKWYFWSGGLFDNIKKKLPITFYDFDEERLNEIKGAINNDEVYNREDTHNIYNFENKLND